MADLATVVKRALCMQPLYINFTVMLMLKV